MENSPATPRPLPGRSPAEVGGEVEGEVEGEVGEEVEGEEEDEAVSGGRDLKQWSGGVQSVDGWGIQWRS